MAEEARVVDVVRAGEQQSETDHKLTGQDTTTRDSDGFKSRLASGWFSYEVKVLPGQPQQLIASIQHGDRSAEAYDVFVDDQLVPGQSLAGGSDIAFNLSPELTRGKQSVTVKFAARPGKSVAGISLLRVLRSPTTP